MIQCIDRGHGVNRTPDNPLGVQILADVALPLVHDSAVDWDTVKPDIFQRMILAGLAVDSPADAAIVHTGLFANADQAKKAFERAGFKGQTPYKRYRGMSIKSTSYRRVGRGRSWQTVWWSDALADDPRGLLEASLSTALAWKPSE